MGKYVDRAKQGVLTGKGITYRLGQGGYYPSDATPSRTGLCDCAGFVAWVLGRSRKPSKVWPWWLSSSSVWSDAGGDRVVFVELPEPQPGCVAVYPDYRSGGTYRHGHLAVVVDPARKTVIDCGSSSNRISQRSGAFFWARTAGRPATRWVVLRADFDAAAGKVDP